MARTNFEYDHSVGASLDYSLDWGSAGWLQSGETIVDSDWTVPTGLTLGTTQILGGVTSAFLIGGTAGVIYKVINTITTNSVPARTDSRTITLSCKQR